jgi:hypothetical protein
MIDRSCDVCGRTWLGVAERTLLLELEPAMRPGILYGTDDDACPPGAAGLLEAMLAAWRDELAPVPWPGDLVLQPHDLVVRRGSGALTVDHVGGGGDRRRADLAATPATPVVTSSVRANGLGCPWSRSTTYEGRSILMRHDGSTLKVNLCLSDLPRFTCLPEDCGQFGPTIHLLPDEGSCSPSLGAPTPMPRRVAPGVPQHRMVHPLFSRPVAPRRPSRRNAALFVQWGPPHARREQVGGGGDPVCGASPVDLRPGTSSLVEDTFVLHRPRSSSTSASAAGTCITWTTRSASPTGTPTNTRSPRSTAAVPAVTRRVRSSVLRASSW